MVTSLSFTYMVLKLLCINCINLRVNFWDICVSFMHYVPYNPKNNISI